MLRFCSLHDFGGWFNTSDVHLISVFADDSPSSSLPPHRHAVLARPTRLNRWPERLVISSRLYTVVNEGAVLSENDHLVVAE